MLVRKFPELGFRDVGQCCVALPSMASVLLSTGTGGMEVSPPGPNLHTYTYTYTPLSYLLYSKKNLVEIHTCIKNQLFRKTKTEPFLALFHASK